MVGFWHEGLGKLIVHWCEDVVTALQREFVNWRDVELLFVCCIHAVVNDFKRCIYNSYTYRIVIYCSRCF